MKKKSKSKPTKLEAALRQAVLESALTRYSVAKRSGVDVAALLRFISGKRTLTLPKAGKLAEFLELELRSKKK